MSKRLRFIVVLGMVAVLLSSCATTEYTMKYMETGNPRIRKVEAYDGETHVKTFYEMYDLKLRGWFEAEERANGDWDYTPNGKGARTAVKMKQKMGQ